VAKATVEKYRVRPRKPPSPGWLALHEPAGIGHNHGVMRPEILSFAGFHQALFDALPLYVFVVDPDVRIHGYNVAASTLFDRDVGDVLSSPGGKMLNCINQSRSPEGCGHSEDCKDCAIRNSVNEAVAGHKVFRQKCRMRVVRSGRVQDLHLLVTASPFSFNDTVYVLVILEDINELIQLRRFLPICASCKKIRNDENLWEEVEVYIARNVDVDFTHSLCEECEERLYPDVRVK
jgi:PAS domain-containing protein